MTLVLEKSGAPLQLGPELARGGEGIIYAVANDKDRVAKIYLKPPTEKKIAKLRAMSAGASESLARISAWPLDLVKDGGKIKGFIMPRLSAHEDVHELYSPKSRATTFPEADFRFIVHAATNVARSFAEVHAAGYVIGDVNHAHLLVSRDARVALIDCDSFQVRVEGRLLPCEVGSPLFTPPELQGASFGNMERSPSHDEFGLAVILFHLLFMGRHPFSGVWTGPGDMIIENAIKDYRFAYSVSRPASEMKQPPATVGLGTFGPEIASRFEQAFSRASLRPTAADWIAPLTTLEKGLRQCGRVSAHHYPASRDKCPWCVVEEQSGARLFGQRIRVATGQASVDVAALWQAIERVPHPSPDPPLPSGKAWSPPPGTPTPFFKHLRMGVGVTLAVAGLAGCVGAPESGMIWTIMGGIACVTVWPRPPQDKVRAAAAATEQARSTLQQLENRWQREASVHAFEKMRQDLSAARDEFRGLPARRTKMIAQLQADRQAYQKRQYLDRFKIRNAKIPGIGQSRAATLASFGIETAADVEPHRIMGIRGFGPSLSSALIAWRMSHEANFRFNAAAPVDPRELARVEAEISGRYAILLKQLQEGATKLHITRLSVESARPRLEPLLEAAWSEFKVAQARQKAL